MAGQNILVAASISPKVIVSQQLIATEQTIYTVPAGMSVKVAQGTLCNVTSNAAAPVLTLGTTAGSGGTFAAATYFWKITAKSASGETLGSNEVTAAIATNGTQVLSWTAVPGASTYNVYRGTATGAESVIITNTTALTYTDTGNAGAAAAVPTASTFSAPVTVYLSIVKVGGTVGDGTHRVLSNYSLAGNDTLPLKDYIGGAMLGPGDIIAGYASQATSVDFVLTGTVHA
jgi:hypothetical protein